MEEDKLSIFEPGIDDNVKSNLQNISQWATITAIASLVGLGITILQLILLAAKYSFSFAGQQFLESIIQIVVSIIMNVLLFNAASQIKKSLNAPDQSMLNKGLANLKAYFKIYGIVFIIVMVIVLLAIIYFSTTYRGY
ncbi:MAG: DUF5362 family protein [Ferruginibacter sp.]